MKKTTANNKPAVNKLPQYTRQDLLGDIDKAFTLGDSEVVAQRIFEFILKLVMNKVRLKQVDSLMNDYITDKTFKMINRIVDCEMNMLNYDQDREVKEGKSMEIDRYVFNISKPKVDNWASNKTNIIVIKQPDTPTDLNKSNLSAISQGGNTFNKTLAGLSRLVVTSANRNKEKESFIQNKSRAGFDSMGSKRNFNDPTLDSINSLNLNRKALKDEAPIKKFAAMNFMNLNNKKVEVDELEQYNLEISQNKEEPQDEMDLLKEKAFRAYFREKELERERKRNLDTENEEKNREDEKRRRKLLEEMTKRPFSFDFEGKVLNVRPPDIQKMTKQAPFPSGVVKDKNMIEDGVIRHLDGNENDKSNANTQSQRNMLRKSNEKARLSQSQLQIKKKIVPVEVEIINSDDDNQIIESTPDKPRYYQPDPLTSHEVPPGVTMEFYGVKKTGGKYPETQGKLSNEEFQILLSKYKPKIKFYTKPKNLHHMINNLPNEDRKKYIEEHQPGSQEPFRLTQIFEIKDTEDENYYDEEGSFKNQQQIKKENIIKRFDKPDQNIKTTIDWKKKNDKAKVSALNDFNLENYLPEDVENMYDVFKYYNENKNEIITQSHFRKKLPDHLHQNKSKDKNNNKKNPRDRISKEILAVKNKTVTIVAKEKVDKKSEAQNLQINSKIPFKKK
jgi:hypothetical protein